MARIRRVFVSLVSFTGVSGPTEIDEVPIEVARSVSLG